MDEMEFHAAFNSISEILYLANSNLSQNEFWTLTKTDADRIILETLLFVNFEIVRIASILLRPYIPNLS